MKRLRSWAATEAAMPRGFLLGYFLLGLGTVVPPLALAGFFTFVLTSALLTLRSPDS